MAVLKSNWLYTLQKLSFSPWFPFVFSIVSGFAVVGMYLFGTLDGYERIVYDWRFVHRPDKTVTDSVAVVYINDSTLRNMSESLGRWPWSRETWAAFQQEILTGVKTRTSVYDVVFDLPDKDRGTDAAFAQTIQMADNVLLACLFRQPVWEEITLEDRLEFQNDWAPPPDSMKRFALNLAPSVREELAENLPDYMAVTLPLPELLENAAGCGPPTYQPDPDGVVRRFPLVLQYAGEFYPSLPLLAAVKHRGLPLSSVQVVPGKYVGLPLNDGEIIRIPIDDQARMLVNFRSADPAVFPSLNFAEAWESYFSWKETGKLGRLVRLFDRTVIVGSTAEATEDIRGIPLDDAYPMTYVVATVTDNILKGDYLRESTSLDNAAWILINAILIGYWSMKFRPTIRFMLTVGQTVMVFGANFWLFYGFGYCLPLIGPVFSIAFPFTAILLVKYLFERNARKYAEGLFGRYLDKRIVAQLVRNPEIIGLGGAKKEVTLVFTDLKGFTPISENMSSEEIVRMLNDYFEEMYKAVLNNDGVVDKYIGDAMMVVFGLPSGRPDDAYRAVKCGLEMIERLKQRRNSPEPGFFANLNMRVGINTGEVVAGNIGTELKQQYTVIGDVVNVANRLESNAPVNGVLISASTYEKVAKLVDAEPLGTIQVKGKSHGVQVYQVKGLKAF